jgi:outer membrane lipoprotein SlyB
MRTMARYLGSWCSLGIVVVLGGCAASRPVLYPNQKLESVGSAAAEREIQDCEARAQQYVDNGARVKQVGRDTAVGAGTGAAVGAVVGAIGGNPGEAAAQGAAGGATAGLVHGIFTSTEPSSTFKSFVERCLHERGYETIGWE